MPGSYYNTNEEEGRTLQESQSRALRQEDLIEDLFRRNPWVALTPCEVWSLLFHGSTPITSVRRAITNLTDRGILEKTGKMCMGVFGKRVHTWTLAKRKPMEQQSLF